MKHFMTLFLLAVVFAAPATAGEVDKQDQEAEAKRVMAPKDAYNPTGAYHCDIERVAGTGKVAEPISGQEAEMTGKSPDGRGVLAVKPSLQSFMIQIAPPRIGLNIPRTEAEQKFCHPANLVFWKALLCAGYAKYELRIPEGAFFVAAENRHLFGHNGTEFYDADTKMTLGKDGWFSLTHNAGQQGSTVAEGRCSKHQIHKVEKKTQKPE